MKDHYIPTNDIWKVYNLSPTVLNRIKRATDEEVDLMRTKKITKIYGTKKQRLIKWLDEYIKTNRTTFTSKEVTKFINFELNT